MVRQSKSGADLPIMIGAYANSCCCEPTPPEGQCCEFASSYLMSGMNGSLQAVWNSTPVSECPVCDGGVVTDEIDKYEISNTWSMPSSVTLTRYTDGGTPATCCYAATGNVEINWSFSADEQRWCCINPQILCSLENVFTGSALVPFCYTVICATIEGETRWLHSLTICDFYCDVIDLLDRPAFCALNANCEDLPIAPTPLRMIGARYSWHTTKKALDLLLPVDWTAIGVCGQLGYCGIEYPGQDTFNQNTSCMYEVVQAATHYGPFSPYFSADLDPCTRGTPTGINGFVLRSTFGDCSFEDGGLYGCADNLTNATPCCDAGMSSNWAYPNFS